MAIRTSSTPRDHGVTSYGVDTEPVIAIFRHWWSRPDQYDVLSNYLAARNLQTFARLATALYMGGMGAVTILMTLGPNAPTSPLLRAVSFIFAAGWIIEAVVWSVRWPTRRQSLALIVFIEAGFAYNCLAAGDARFGLTACIAFTALAAFIAFLHTGIHLVIMLAVALSTTALCAAQYALSGDPAGALAALITVMFSLLSVPITVKVSMHILGDLAAETDTDELTGLLNRRGFGRAAEDLADAVLANGGTYFGVMMIDLDRFKLVNDTQGHAAGDELLIAVGAILVEAAGTDKSVVARYGGEEFVIAAALDSAALHVLAENIRTGVAALADGVTASVGVCDLHSVDSTLMGPLLQHLVDGADDAMYEAKHDAGNRVARRPARTP